MRIVICDDEAGCRISIRELIEKQGTCDDITELSSGEELLRYLRGNKVDIIFLDIAMSKDDGIRTAQQFRSSQTALGRHTWGSLPFIVFVTGFSEYMPDAFDVNAFGFLVKPVKEDDFLNLYRRAAFEIHSITDAKKREEKVIPLKKYGCSGSVRAGDVLYIESSGHKSIIYLLNGKKLEVAGKISDLEIELGEDFFRVHRCYLANLDKIERYDRREIRMESGCRIPLSRYKYQDFVRACLRQVTGI